MLTRSVSTAQMCVANSNGWRKKCYLLVLFCTCLSVSCFVSSLLCIFWKLYLFTQQFVFVSQHVTGQTLPYSVKMAQTYVWSSFRSLCSEMMTSFHSDLLLCTFPSRQETILHWPMHLGRDGLLAPQKCHDISGLGHYYMVMAPSMPCGTLVSFMLSVIREGSWNPDSRNNE